MHIYVVYLGHSTGAPEVIRHRAQNYWAGVNACGEYGTGTGRVVSVCVFCVWENEREARVKKQGVWGADLWTQKKDKRDSA